MPPLYNVITNAYHLRRMRALVPLVAASSALAVSGCAGGPGVGASNESTGANVTSQSPPMVLSEVSEATGRAAMRSVSMVGGYWCGGGVVQVGSAWPYAPGLLVTNAHVVSGVRSVAVSTPGGQTQHARVVLFDHTRDIAVLRSPGLRLNSFALAPGSPPENSPAMGIGYPGAKQEVASRALVVRAHALQAHDIYQQPVAMTWDYVKAHFHHGDSGGPLINSAGQVWGVIAQGIEGSLDAGVIDVSDIRGDLNAARNRTAPVSTGPCVG